MNRKTKNKKIPKKKLWMIKDPTTDLKRMPKKYTYKENGKIIRLYEQENKSLKKLQKEIQIRNMKNSNLDINKKEDDN